eukprot:scaffold2006_cov283-Chaetoceros_neogracile.AAC.3
MSQSSFPRVTFLFGTASHRQSARFGFDVCEDVTVTVTVDGAGAQQGASANWGVAGGRKNERTKLADLSKVNLLMRITLRIMLNWDEWVGDGP